jgi:hypothetical protein
MSNEVEVMKNTAYALDKVYEAMKKEKEKEECQNS